MTTTISSTCARSSSSDSSFWDSVQILLTKPHVVNKRLWGCKTLFMYTCRPILQNWNLSLHCKRLKNTHDIGEFKYLLDELQLKESLDTNVLEVVLTELLPKTYSENHAFQLVVLQRENGIVTFYDVTPETAPQNLCPEFTFTLQLNHDKVLLTAACDSSSKSYQWLKDTVLPQFVKWGQECPNKAEKQHICNESLSLVSNDKYYEKYNELKLKYGKEMVKIWPECTDPSKFVYEDIAIATYLLLLWDNEKSLNLNHKQTFVDLGCGNGLLVYILTKEGHCGVGIDVRKRQIWDMYTADVKLEEKTITPSDSHLFPKTDWIIGNHTDELTPWVPVIAARSSYKCNFFLLPCCAYNFDGTKYKRQNSSKSQYTEYLEFIKQLCVDCGFRTDTDRLKIPSTKRICLVGRGRTHPQEEHVKYCNCIQNIINSETNCIQGDNNQTSWIKNFKARDPVEKVRNCTQIDKTVIESIVDSISKYLLEGCSISSTWTEGRTVEIAEVVQLLCQDKLKALKSECGGLQTLLRNNHHIFKVQGGTVQLRHPKTVEEVTNGFKSSRNKASTIKLKVKPCWFHNNHPQGCPLTEENCSFLHVKINLSK